MKVHMSYTTTCLVLGFLALLGCSHGPSTMACEAFVNPSLYGTQTSFDRTSATPAATTRPTDYVQGGQHHRSWQRCGCKPPSSPSPWTPTSSRVVLCATAPEKQTTTWGEEEKPAGIVGAQFFGGDKQKLEFYDEQAELDAAKLDKQSRIHADDLSDVAPVFQRFAVVGEDAGLGCFQDALSANVARSLQSQINAVLYEGFDGQSSTQQYTYATSSGGGFKWNTPLSKSSDNPWAELEQSLGFYNQLDLAITKGKKVSESVVELEWELSLVWPTFWRPRVLIMGYSTFRLDGTTIVEQSDHLMDGYGKRDILSLVGSQVKPRFWDWYHVGMSPCAELMPKWDSQKKAIGFLGVGGPYQVYEIPSRIAIVATRLDTGDREDGNAIIIPNHAFSCIIKTVGPARQRYVTTTPVEVQLIPSGGGFLQIQWSIPVSVEFLAKNKELPPAGEDPEAEPGSEPTSTYLLQPRRMVASVAYGGNPQDVEISEVRKKLYEQVTKDGLKPKLDDNGRPIFLFMMNTVKTCYTEEGLGMCVYEFRPKWSKPNEVGIELES